MSYLTVLGILIAVLTTVKLSIDVGEKLYAFYYKLYLALKKRYLLPKKHTIKLPKFHNNGYLIPYGDNKKNLLA